MILAGEGGRVVEGGGPKERETIDFFAASGP